MPGGRGLLWTTNWKRVTCLFLRWSVVRFLQCLCTSFEWSLTILLWELRRNCIIMMEFHPFEGRKGFGKDEPKLGKWLWLVHHLTYQKASPHQTQLLTGTKQTTVFSTLFFSYKNAGTSGFFWNSILMFYLKLAAFPGLCVYELME